MKRHGLVFVNRSYIQDLIVTLSVKSYYKCQLVPLQFKIDDYKVERFLKPVSV